MKTTPGSICFAMWTIVALLCWILADVAPTFHTTNAEFTHHGWTVLGLAAFAVGAVHKMFESR